MLPDDKVMCHETGFEKRCKDMVVNCHCRKWIQVMGNNPNTGEPINRWDCSDAWLPLLLIENSQMQRQTGAAVESFRNEATRNNTQLCDALTGVAVAATAAAHALPPPSRPLKQIEN